MVFIGGIGMIDNRFVDGMQRKGDLDSKKFRRVKINFF